jgi:hypothetical protein
MGLSGAGDTTAWAQFANPAGISTLAAPIAGMGYHNAFGLEDLSSKSAFAYLPTPLVTASASYVNYGHPLYSLQRFAAGISRKMSPRLHMGVRLAYLLRGIGGIENDGTFLLDAGMRFSPTPALMFGIMALNPGRAKIINQDTEQIFPSLLALALTYHVSPEVNIIVDLMHQSQSPTQHYALEMEAQVHPSVMIRGAISDQPVRLAIGSGLKWQHFQFDISVNHHNPLGFSSSAGLSYTFPERR